jgi:hypothetical protein
MGRRPDPLEIVWLQGAEAFAFLREEFGFEDPNAQLTAPPSIGRICTSMSRSGRGRTRWGSIPAFVGSIHRIQGLLASPVSLEVRRRESQMITHGRGTWTGIPVRLASGLLFVVTLLALAGCGDRPGDAANGATSGPGPTSESDETSTNEPLYPGMTSAGQTSTARPPRRPAASGAPPAPGAAPAPGGAGQASGGPGALGAPLRIPLPADSLLGRDLSNADAQLRGLVANACGGDQCISLRTVPVGSMDPNGRSGCITRVKRVRDTVAEPYKEGSEQKIPVLYVPRGGVITLEVELSCDVTTDPATSTTSTAGPSTTTSLEGSDPTGATG